MSNKKVLLLTRVDNPDSASIHSAETEREIVFVDDMVYAVIMASRYEGKGYTTHSTLETTSKKIRQRNMEGADYVVIDRDGQKYFKDYQENGKFILSKVTTDAFVDHTVLSDKEFVLTWSRPGFGKNIDMTVVAKDIDTALDKFRKQYRGVENLKEDERDPETQGERWIVYSCGVASTESIYVRGLEVNDEQPCAS